MREGWGAWIAHIEETQHVRKGCKLFFSADGVRVPASISALRPPCRSSQDGTFAPRRALPARCIQGFNPGILMVDNSGGQKEAVDQPGKASEAEVLAAVAALREDVRRLTDDLARFAESQRVAAGAAVAGAINEARGQVSQVASGLQGFASDVGADMRMRIRAKPIASVLIAAFVGYAWRCARQRR